MSRHADTLLAQDPATVKTLLEAKGENMVIPGTSKKGPKLRREPLGQKALQYSVNMTPLIAAMTFASRAVCEKLLDAGAPVDRCGDGLGERSSATGPVGHRPSRPARDRWKHENVDLLLERYPQYANALHPEVGLCPLHLRR